LSLKSGASVKVLAKLSLSGTTAVAFSASAILILARGQTVSHGTQPQSRRHEEGAGRVETLRSGDRRHDEALLPVDQQQGQPVAASVSRDHQALTSWPAIRQETVGLRVRYAGPEQGRQPVPDDGLQWRRPGERRGNEPRHPNCQPHRQQCRASLGPGGVFSHSGFQGHADKKRVQGRDVHPQGPGADELPELPHLMGKRTRREKNLR
uniref:Transmembrane protein n=1 Tax=Macrostomum lignano TaxID=282301 RepID=A0A1I8HIZ3_9PLAT